MKNSECAKAVLDWALTNYLQATSAYSRASCEESARFAAEKAWNEYNPDDGVGCPSSNPYSGRQKGNLREMERTGEIMMNAKAILDFVKGKICDMIDKE